jgi:hypothetical protein
VPRFTSDFPCYFLGAPRVGVADQYLVYAGVTGQHAGVESSDTAGS